MSILTAPYADPSVIARRVRFLRLRDQLSQQDLAAHAGIDQRQISRIELAEVGSLRLTDVLAVASALQCDLTSLLGDDDTPFTEHAGEVGIPTGTPVDLLTPWAGMQPHQLLMVTGAGAAEAIAHAAREAGTIVDELDGLLSYPGTGELQIVDWTGHTPPTEMMIAASSMARRARKPLVVAVGAPRGETTGAVRGSNVMFDYADYALSWQEGTWTVLKNRYGPQRCADGEDALLATL